jgi:hypothetical protein
VAAGCDQQDRGDGREEADAAAADLALPAQLELAR